MTNLIIDDRTLEACQRGDPEAYRLLFEAHKDRVYSIALCFFDGDEAAAKDITQEVFLKLMTFISQFQNRSEFSTWLHRIVTNACLDRKRAYGGFYRWESRTNGHCRIAGCLRKTNTFKEKPKHRYVKSSPA